VLQYQRWKDSVAHPASVNETALKIHQPDTGAPFLQSFAEFHSAIPWQQRQNSEKQELNKPI
jgi:hypothetical protein